MSGVSVITSETEPVDPPINCLIVNTTGTLNQYFCWAGECARGRARSTVHTSKRGSLFPTQVQDADWLGTLGAVNPSSLQWDTDPQACSERRRRFARHALWRSTARPISSLLMVASALSRTACTASRRRSTRVPTTRPITPLRRRLSWTPTRRQTTSTSVGFVIDILAGRCVAAAGYSFFESQLGGDRHYHDPAPIGPEHVDSERG